MKKGCLLALGLVVAFVAGILILIFGMTAGVVKAGDQFLSQLGSGEIAQAYTSTSNTLKSQQTAEAFEETVKKLGLTEYASASWSNREMNNDRGHLEGTVTTRAGGKIPLRIELIKESGSWKVLSLSAPEAGVTVEKPSQKTGEKTVPSDPDLKRLVLSSLLDFNAAVQQKSFVGFHHKISKLWQDQITPEQLQTVFKSFVDNEIDIKGIQDVDPEFDGSPAIDSNGIMVVKGSYPTKPLAVRFQLKYVDEGATWKLFGINVKVE